MTRRCAITTAILASVCAFSHPAASAAGRDRTPPTRPSNFRVTAKTPFSVSLAWSPSTDNSGSFTYRLWSTAGGNSITLPRTATSFTWNTNVYPRNSYTFGLYAVDAAGNNSSQANLSTTVPPDTTAPSAGPVVSVAEVGSNYVTLDWTPAQDDGPFLFYQVWQDGVFYGGTGTERSVTVRFLRPATTYTFLVRAYDYGPNLSPFSNAVTVTTLPANPADTTPPTVPGNLRAQTFGSGDGETELSWTESTDDFDDPEHIRYDVFVNGVLSDVRFGTGRRSFVYGELGVLNLIEVIASDTAGNASEPAMITVDFR